MPSNAASCSLWTDFLMILMSPFAWKLPNASLWCRVCTPILLMLEYLTSTEQCIQVRYLYQCTVLYNYSFKYGISCACIDLHANARRAQCGAAGVPRERHHHTPLQVVRRRSRAVPPESTTCNWNGLRDSCWCAAIHSTVLCSSSRNNYLLVKNSAFASNNSEYCAILF